MPCAEGCLLRQVTIQRAYGDFNGVSLRFAIDQMSIGPKGQPGTKVDLGPVSAAAWQSITNDNSDDVTVDPDHPLSFTAETFGFSWQCSEAMCP